MTLRQTVGLLAVTAITLVIIGGITRWADNIARAWRRIKPPFTPAAPNLLPTVGAAGPTRFPSAVSLARVEADGNLFPRDCLCYAAGWTAHSPDCIHAMRLAARPTSRCWPEGRPS